MACITYLNSFSAPNALEILARCSEHEVVRIAGDAPTGQSFDILARAHAYQCVGARDEVPLPLRVSAEFLARAPDLLVVSVSGSGVDVFDLEACTEAGVLAVNQAGANAQSVAEHALAMMISVQRAIVRADRVLRAGWQGSRLEFMGTDLAGKTVGIVGIGNIGTRLARICCGGFGSTVLATDPFVKASEIERRGAQSVTFDELLQHADIISVHTPLTSDTRGLFDADAFARMKAGAVFINTARGFIHDEDALANALACGHLGGAGLDVWDVEPPQPNHRLMQMGNVIATPHVAGCTSDSLHNMAEHAATQLLDIFSGKPAARPVNPDVLPKFKERYAQILGEPALK
ncbi:MAG TPA: 3-phosphoglycerate dehydrogenase [Gammaproteobacteria bacterium]|jgi:D-3-phosphoglycerate dehydrogenase|nr:3-phosphoglycerate dehydrogenase [Acidiferrobacteraceae bacterium]MDP6397782.1 hydroxyacid dehydrogenase [Arenicellales bacterium]HCX86698.1 3-phosphoglycerate dehydrogenase [Gammaproteobacteria bacterium]MDP6552019.1 hydroxyacid dehydrogenase [Arenicellales bacterium]MDP6791893.1 hydroxyacid dehydrogenase [Arenicellales bacterium]|tara:strand:- start:18054 stop:19094 length:1041 start_codon:yes stop_codon:yes gene_type:complete